MQLTYWLAQMFTPSKRRRRGISRRGALPAERFEDRTLLSTLTETGQIIPSASHLAAMGDVDGDGDLDVFTSSALSAVPNKIWLNDGTGGFVDSGQSLGQGTSSRPYGTFADLDGDGDLDLACKGIWLNDGQGVFMQHSFFAKAGTYGDVDGDGDLDFLRIPSLIDLDPFQPTQFWFNDGNANLILGPTVGIGGNSVALGDIDGDGDVDAFVGASLNDNGRTMLNDGQGNFTDHQHGFPGWKGAEFADLDGDADLDLVLDARIYVNDGAGSFVDSGQRLTMSVNDFALGDVDGDGDLDIYYGSFLEDELWLNDGTGQFAKSEQQLESARTRDVAMGDLNGDGLDDVIITGDFGASVWLSQEVMQSVALPAGGGTADVIIDGTDLVVQQQAGGELYRHDSATLPNLVVSGSSDADTLNVDLTGGTLPTGFALTINADGGNDVVNLLGLPAEFDGTITVNGQTGDDLLDASALSYPVTLDGGSGNDTLAGGSSGDLILGGSERDRLNGKQGDDTLMGEAGPDKLFGGAGRDWLDGGADNDVLRGHGGVDTLTGGDGDDRLIGGGGKHDRVVESAVGDLVLTDTQLTGRGTDELIGIEKAELTGNNDDNTLDARDFTGRVTLSGGDGADMLIGGANHDYLDGGAGNDTLAGRDGRDKLYGGDGDDGLSGMAGADKLMAGDGHDTLLGGDGNDTLRGQLGDDMLLGEAGIDNVSGNRGHDTVTGAGNGTATDPNDTAVGEMVDDEFAFNAAWVNV